MVYNGKTIHSQRSFDTQIMSGSILYIDIIGCTLSLFLYHFSLLLIQETSLETFQFYEKNLETPKLFFGSSKPPKDHPTPPCHK